uniref:XPG N-terminal domain-containing protein n=1 Tax=viral metagenome TaxID=1070528 RepID=A0A6C0JIW5_9ZZZZ
MGIKNLNRFLRDNCSKRSIRKVHLKQFANKIVVIDTSIYLYKFMSEGALMENMYLFISILKSYYITPIFIFDGKPPPEKKELLNKRRMEKKDAEIKYKNIESALEKVSVDEKKEMLMEMDLLKRQFIRINQDDIRNVKELLDAYGISYYESPSEADAVCAYLTKIGKVWACLSDDMDMFLYGCPRVIRHLSLMNHTVVLYDTKAILKDLQMTERQFCEIMVLSGTDYNLHSNTCLYETMRWYQEYRKYLDNYKNKNENDVDGNAKPQLEFYVWLVKNTKYINDYLRLLKTYQMFQMNNNIHLNSWQDVQFDKKSEDIASLKNIMKEHGFVFTR